MRKLGIGKLKNEKLKELVIDKIRYKDPGVSVKAGVGEDCAYLDFDKDYCVVSTDPITASIADIGRLAVNISCNDIASCGVRPFAILLTLMLPEESTEEDINTIMHQAAGEAEKLEVEIAGGHTEVTKAVNVPVIVATAMGKAPKDNTPARGGIKNGDVLIVTKSVGLEGVSIMAADRKEKVREMLSEEEYKTAVLFGEKTSVLKEGIIAGKIGVNAMHDITEGGVLGAVWEICDSQDAGAIVYDEAIPVEPVTKKLCESLGADYRKLISSGSMLIAADKGKADELIGELKKAGIDATVIGEIRNAEEGIKLAQKTGEKDIESPGSDELYKVII